MTALDASLRLDGVRSVVELFGEVDVAAAPDVVALASAALTRPDLQTLVLDMGHVDFMDSSGIGALIQIRHLCDDYGATLELRDVGERVHEVLDITGLAEHFGVTDDDLGRE
jgi:anti-sigma B factor antagonist